MFDLFVEPIKWTGGTISIPQTQYMKSQLQVEIKKVISYVTSSSMFLQSQQFIVRLLGTLISYYEKDRECYMRKIYDDLGAIEKIHRLVSATNSQATHHIGALYNRDCQELFISTIEYFDTYNEDPKNITPIKVISHPFSDLSMGLADGKYRSLNNESGLVVVSIDIARLAYLFHHWISDNTDQLSEKVFGIFAMQQVIARMIPSHIDVAFFNRMHRKLMSKPTADYFAVYPLAIVDYTNKVDEIIDMHLNLYSKSNIVYEQVLSALPSISHESLAQALSIVDTYINRNNAWAFLMARLDIYLFIIDLANAGGESKEIERLKNKIRLTLKSINDDESSASKISYDVTSKLNRLKFVLQ